MKEVISRIYDDKFKRYLKELESRDSVTELSIVTVGDDPASKVYVRNKIKVLSECGVVCNHVMKDPVLTTQEDLELLAVETEHPILFQLPLPNGLKAPDLPISKDVDGFGLEAMSHILNGTSSVLPCTVQAVLDIIYYYENSVEGLNVAVIGRSNIVGKPLAVELINRQATVTSFNSKSEMDEETNWRHFDIVVVATGHYGVVKSSWFHKGQLVIDVGINRVDGKLVGDVEHDVFNERVNITPVPGGVGRLTVMNVLGNLMKLSCK